MYFALRFMKACRAEISEILAPFDYSDTLSRLPLRTISNQIQRSSNHVDALSFEREVFALVTEACPELHGQAFLTNEPYCEHSASQSEGSAAWSGGLALHSAVPSATGQGQGSASCRETSEGESVELSLRLLAKAPPETLRTEGWKNLRRMLPRLVCRQGGAGTAQAEATTSLWFAVYAVSSRPQELILRTVESLLDSSPTGAGNMEAGHPPLHWPALQREPLILLELPAFILQRPPTLRLVLAVLGAVLDASRRTAGQSESNLDQAHHFLHEVIISRCLLSLCRPRVTRDEPATEQSRIRELVCAWLETRIQVSPQLFETLLLQGLDVGSVQVLLDGIEGAFERISHITPTMLSSRKLNVQLQAVLLIAVRIPWATATRAKHQDQDLRFCIRLLSSAATTMLEAQSCLSADLLELYQDCVGVICSLTAATTDHVLRSALSSPLKDFVTMLTSNHFTSLVKQLPRLNLDVLKSMTNMPS